MTVRKYDAAARHLDAQAHQLVGALLAGFPDTIIVGLADHGEEFWERGGMGHGTTLHAEQANVPFFIHGPGLQPRTVDVPVNIIHLLPTLAAHLGLPPRPQWQGKDLFAGPLEALGPVFSWTRGGSDAWGVHIASVQHGPHKLIVSKNRGENLLFNVAEDPAELRNLAAAQPQTVERLNALLRAHSYENQRQQSPGATVRELDPEERRRLEALGYFGGAESKQAQ